MKLYKVTLRTAESFALILMTMMISRMMAKITTRIMPEEKFSAKKQLLFELMSLAFMKNGVTLTNTSYYSKMALMTTVTYDKKSGRVVDSRRVDSEGGSTFLLVVLGVLGTLNILFNMNICILLLSTIIRVSGEKL